MILVQNRLNKTCSSQEGCKSTFIVNKKKWLCRYHLKIEYEKQAKEKYIKRSKIGIVSWNKGNKKPIRKVSLKRAIENKIYIKKRKEFLDKPENKYCFIDGCNKIANTIEHTAGRIGEMYLNEKYWRPCCLEHNLELENNSELSKKYQLSKFHHGYKL